MADEKEESEARERHRRTVESLRDLRGDALFRLDDIMGKFASRDMDDFSEERGVRADIRGELVSLQRRIDKTISALQ